MQPDPEQERVWQTRLQELLKTAPEPDQDRLDAGAARVRAVRRQRKRRWLGAALTAAAVGGAVAAASWWAGSERPSGASMPPDQSPAERAANGAPEARENEDAKAPTPTPSDDSPVIYRR